MKLIIETDGKEIADLVFALQSQRNQELGQDTDATAQAHCESGIQVPATVIRQAAAEGFLRASCDTEEA